MKLRKAKKTDQEIAAKACQLMDELIKSHPEIEPSLWMAGVWSATVQSYINSGVSFKEFEEKMLGRILHYKKWWDEK